MSNIEWTDKTWNPIIGCSPISPGCKECWAKKMAYRLMHMPYTDYYQFVLDDNGEEDPDLFRNIPEWNGQTHFVKSALEKPLKRQKPTKYFVCSMGDLFHENVPFEWVDKVMAIIAQCEQHTFQILTKRPLRMKEYFTSNWQCRILNHVKREEGQGFILKTVNGGKLPNLWLGVTTENQEQANKRIPYLLKTPAAVRFVSVEPLLGPIDFYDITLDSEFYHTLKGFGDISLGSRGYVIGLKLDWVICGGESGPKARPIHPNWVRSLRDQCKDAGVPFFFKQWGEWYTAWFDMPTKKPVFKMFDSFLQWQQKHWVNKGDACISIDGTWCRTGGDLKRAKYPVAIMQKVGKKKAGCLLDGKEYKEFPKIKEGAK